jgi:hypothetical protein
MSIGEGGSGDRLRVSKGEQREFKWDSTIDRRRIPRKVREIHHEKLRREFIHELSRELDMDSCAPPNKTRLKHETTKKSSGILLQTIIYVCNVSLAVGLVFDLTSTCFTQFTNFF